MPNSSPRAAYSAVAAGATIAGQHGGAAGAAISTDTIGNRLAFRQMNAAEEVAVAPLCKSYRHTKYDTTARRAEDGIRGGTVRPHCAELQRC
jgi:hypothetical protein